MFEFEGESGSIGYFTVHANFPGATEFYSFCFNNIHGDPSIWLVDGNLYESALVVVGTSSTTLLTYNKRKGAMTFALHYIFCGNLLLQHEASLILTLRSDNL